MASGDIWFLLIFIILPTALLVSGFWAFLFVRRDPRKTIPRQRQAAAASKSTRENIDETVQVATIPPQTVAESEPAGEEVAAEDDAEPEPNQPLPGPAASELALDDTQHVIDEPVPTDDQLDEDDPPADVEDEETALASHQIADERLVELVDVDDRDDLMAEIQRSQPAQPARLESSTDEIPVLGDAVIEPARLSDTAADYDEWKPRPEAAPDDEQVEAAGNWEITEDELTGDIEDEQPRQGDESASDRQPPDDDRLIDGEEDTDADEPGNHNEGPGASTGDNPRRYRRQRRRLTPSDNGERQGRRGRLLGRRKSEQERPSRRDEGGV